MIKKGAGIDGIRPKDLKNNASFVIPLLTKLINLGLENGIVPDLLKTSIIRPIYKNGVKSDYNNYRPIAILPVIEKILEEVIVRRLTDYLVKFKIIDKNQFGFQKDKNINKLLGNFSNYINSCLSNHMHCLVLYIDFSKAFDTLSHKKLIQTLQRIGIRGNVLKWFTNYLECRSYRVKINNQFSDKVACDFGVPQGSKLGPILYLIYANDLMRSLQGSTTFAYADDTAIVVSDKNIHVGTELMQNQLDIATKWCHDYGLIINATKTKVMHIKPPHLQSSSIELTFHNIECLHNKVNNTINFNETCTTHIEMVNSYKYLGVYVDSNFKWKTHVENLQKKLRKSSYMLFHLSNYATYSVLRQAYLSLAESYIRHGIAAWGSATYCRLLQATQDQLLKILYKKQSYSKNNNITNIHNNTLSNNPITTYNSNNDIRNNNTTRNNNSDHINNAPNNNTTISIYSNVNQIHSNTLNNNTTNVTSISNNNANWRNTSTTNNNNTNNNTKQKLNKNKNSKINNIARDLHLLNIRSIYYTTLTNEFYNDTRFLQVVDHSYNTRHRSQGKFKVPSFLNDYGKNTLLVTLPTIFNKLPVEIINTKNKFKRNKLIKQFFISSQ